MWARMRHWLRQRRRPPRRTVTAEVMTALVDINMLSLNITEAQWLLRHVAPLTDAETQTITRFLEAAAACLAETPPLSAPADQWHALQARARALNAEFTRLRDRVTGGDDRAP